ncbi:MAG: LacI family DNA-binding transcriptional regulator [Woeseiaceae bacterium]
MAEEAKRRRRSGNAPTISDVARKAGVSPMTVSRVINGESHVREVTRSRVRDAIRALGYAPNPAARSLAGASQVHIAMLYANPSAYIAEFLFGGLEQARRQNCQFIVEKCVDGPDIAAEIRRIVSGGVDGILLAPPLADSERLIDLLEAEDIPSVLVTSSRVRDNVSAVSIDDYRAARQMTEHLMSLGHRRIGFLKGHPNQAASERRLAGFRDALAAGRLSCPDELIAQGLFTYRSGLDAAEQLLSLDERPTAVFASNDDMAAATVAVAHRHHLDVPGDLTVCGFDDTPLATTIWPELTTIHQPIAKLSRAAADLLIRKIRARRAGKVQQSKHLVLDYTLVRRHSDAPPRVRPRVRAETR